MKYDTSHVGKYLKVGDIVWFPTYSEEGRTLGFYTGVGSGLVTDIDFVCLVPSEIMDSYNLKNTTVWWYPNENRVVGYCTELTEDNPWGFKEISLTALEDATVVNQFLWVDKYKERAVSLGDDVFLTKEEVVDFNHDWAQSLLDTMLKEPNRFSSEQIQQVRDFISTKSESR